MEMFEQKRVHVHEAMKKVLPSVNEEPANGYKSNAR